jgi:hypothetical protein
MKLFHLFAFFILISAIHCQGVPLANTLSHPDTIFICEVSIEPDFDGIGNDSCWKNKSWHPIDNVWMPWGESLDSIDFSGKYKIVWSSRNNLLYFLIEITDDTISDAYIAGKTAPIYNFDMFEVFIDEDGSGGYHVFDGTANSEQSLGINAENAFAYHIFTDIPESGSSIAFRAEDLGGTDWDHAIGKLYNNHFPNFILYKEGNLIRWEFSLKVFNDSYTDYNSKISEVKLFQGKVMGLSIAYNDDDQPEVDPEVTVRDNFIGSTPVEKEANNDHWKNADDFAIVKLKPDFCPSGE